MCAGIIKLSLIAEQELDGLTCVLGPGRGRYNVECFVAVGNSFLSSEQELKTVVHPSDVPPAPC